MLLNIWNVVLYNPLVNVLAFLVSIIPGGDLGLAIIILTLLVKILLFPLSQRSLESQAKMNLLAPELKKIKAEGGSKEEQAKKTFDLYKKYKTNPFSGCLLLLIQIPIIFALYYVFLKGINFDSGILYSFVKSPETINTNFLGILDLTQKSLFIAILAGISQFLQAYFMPKSNLGPKSDKESFQDNFARSMQMQMKYIFPIIVVFIAYKISSAIALYWIVSNLFAVGQQLYIKRKKIQTLVSVGQK
jgi:YidC/Oxa1 family membrane protein insertase